MRKIVSLLITLLAVLIHEFPALASDAVEIDCTELINEAPPDVTCQRLTLPVDHFKDRRQTIEIPLLLARATAGKRASQAILIPGGGGPGSPVGFGYLYEPGEFLEFYEPLLAAGFDVVFVDQRGAGLSSPMLACEESVDDFRRLVQAQYDLQQSMQIQLESATRCRERLIYSGVNPVLFNTQQSAADFLAIIDSLNYEHWHVLATSYATAIAQAMLLNRPNAFASVVLDSPVPLDYQQPLSQALVREGIRKTIRQCTRRDSCAQRYANIEEKFDTVLARASRQPYKVKIVASDESGLTRRRTLVVDQHILTAMLFTALYSNQSIRQLPKVIDALHDGEVQSLNAFAEELWYQGVDPDYADGLYLSVHCRERLPLEARFERDHPRIVQALEADSQLLLENQRAMCRIWQAGKDKKLGAAGIFTARTLVLAGQLDPIISSADIANTVDNFSNVQTLTEPFSGHAVWYQSDCARRQVARFFSGSTGAEIQCENATMRFD